MIVFRLSPSPANRKPVPKAPPQPSPKGGRSTQPPKTQREWSPAPCVSPSPSLPKGRAFHTTALNTAGMDSRPLGRAGEGLSEGWGGASTSSCFCTGASRTFFTANGGFFYRGHCWRHAVHDGGDGGDDTKENLFSDGRHHRHHQGEAASSAHGFLCLFQPHPNPPQGEGVPPNHLKHSRNGLPPLV